MPTDGWTDVGRKLGALPGAGRDPGPGRALLAAAIVGVLWAQGGALRVVAGMVLAAVLLSRGPDGKSMLQVLSEGVQALLEG